MVINIIDAARLVGPGLARTTIAQMRKKKPKNPDADENGDQPGHDEEVYLASVNLMRNMLEFVCTTAVEDLNSITARGSPAPPSVMKQDVVIPEQFYQQAAQLVQAQLGPNADKIGRTWWQWRKPGSQCKSSWVEMKVDYEERMARKDPGKKVIFYIHGGAYYLGGIGHGLLIQRHARKLKGRCFAPTYRLAPEFPFPCAVQDVLASYLYLLTQVDPTWVVIGGDSAGGGLCLALLQIIRDQGLPMPAGASLSSPWVDLTHSFPSIIMPTKYDYVPSHGFHAKPSLAWPPPNPDEMRELGIPRNESFGPEYEIMLDGEPFTINEQINMYAPNLQLVQPLISPVLAATLGGFCATQVIAGGAELLRDEQIYLAHKMANPTAYPLDPEVIRRNLENPADMGKFPPTEVELLVFDDGPHAATTLGFIEVAKHQYRAISQFWAVCLARAQNAEIEIEDFEEIATPPVPPPMKEGASPWGEHKAAADDRVKPVADSLAELELEDSSQNPTLRHAKSCDSMKFKNAKDKKYVGLRAGSHLPPAVNHMVRYRVTRSGRLYELEPAHMIRSLRIPFSEIGLPKADTLKGWIRYNQKLQVKFASERRRVFEKRQINAEKGYITFPNGEVPPATALAGRRVKGAVQKVEKAPSGAGASILSKIFSQMDSGGPSADTRANTMMDMSKANGAKRASRIIRPDDINLVPLHQQPPPPPPPPPQHYQQLQRPREQQQPQQYQQPQQPQQYQEQQQYQQSQEHQQYQQPPQYQQAQQYQQPQQQQQYHQQQYHQHQQYQQHQQHQEHQEQQQYQQHQEQQQYQQNQQRQQNFI